MSFTLPPEEEGKTPYPMVLNRHIASSAAGYGLLVSMSDLAQSTELT